MDAAFALAPKGYAALERAALPNGWHARQRTDHAQHPCVPEASRSLPPGQNSSRVTRRNWTASSSGNTERSTSTRCQKKSVPIVKCSEPV